MRPVLFLVAAALTLHAAEPAWLVTVAPIITPAEKKLYLSLPPVDRTPFEERFWSTRSIDREEYYRRIEHIDSTFGSSKRGSGANTDPGRVYLSLGAPTKITRIPSSRIFVPLEIWYYDSVPGLLNTELRLMFYQPNSVGLPKLYSPTVDTIRALLLPEAGTVHLFGPNDSVTESDIRQNLKTGPAEDEVITAATGVASGIKYSGNDEILGQRHVSGVDAGDTAPHTGDVAVHCRASRARCPEVRLVPRCLANRSAVGDRGRTGNRYRGPPRLRYRL